LFTPSVINVSLPSAMSLKHLVNHIIFRDLSMQLRNNPAFNIACGKQWNIIEAKRLFFQNKG
jgi:hypothetical protein